MQEDAAKFRLDRRLRLRRGWISAEQLSKELEALPDVSEKGELVLSPQHHASEPAPGAEGEAE